MRTRESGGLAVILDTNAVSAWAGHDPSAWPENDVWIAALARQHGLSVMSRDIHFGCVAGVRRVSW